MHLAILPEVLPVGVDDRGGVVINARRAFFEKRRDDDDAGILARPSRAPWSRAREFPRPARSWRGLPPGKNIASETAPAGRRSARLASPRRECARPPSPCLQPGSVPHCIWTRATFGFLGRCHWSHRTYRTHTTRSSAGCADCYFTESAGTILMLSTFIRFSGRSPGSVFVVAIFSSTSSPLISLPKAVYWPSRNFGAP